MKKALSVFCIFLLVLAFGACKTRQLPEETTAPKVTPAEDAVPLRLVSGAGTETLVLAGKTGGELYTMNANGLTLTVDGAPAEPAALENGMLLYFEPDFIVLETWPGQITDAKAAATRTPEADDHGDLCGLYLQVLEDLWEEDSGLNGGITYLSVDLETAPGDLTDGEKAAIAWIFSGRHNAQGLQLSFEGLRENGYVPKDELYWEDGLLFSIKKTASGNDGANQISFDAQKWRSGTGAIFFEKCKAERGAGLSWGDYTPGSFAVA